VWVLEFEQGLLKAALQQELQPSIRPEIYGSGAFKRNRSSDTLIASSGRRLRLIIPIMRLRGEAKSKER
jgi:hypothetical protein